MRWPHVYKGHGPHSNCEGKMAVLSSAANLTLVKEGALFDVFHCTFPGVPNDSLDYRNNLGLSLPQKRKASYEA